MQRAGNGFRRLLYNSILCGPFCIGEIRYLRQNEEEEGEEENLPIMLRAVSTSTSTDTSTLQRTFQYSFCFFPLPLLLFSLSRYSPSGIHLSTV